MAVRVHVRGMGEVCENETDRQTDRQTDHKQKQQRQRQQLPANDKSNSVCAVIIDDENLTK